MNGTGLRTIVIILTLMLLQKGSNVKASWLCRKFRHSYTMSINSRTSGRGCPYCAGKKVLQGFNDLESCYPEIAEEWDYSRNGKTTPLTITYGSNRKAYWKCSQCSNTWKTNICERTLQKHGCPECAKHVINHISKQEDTVAEYIKTYLINGKCQYAIFRSKTFKQIYAYAGINVNIINNGLHKYMRKELDIYIPELNLAVEYDGDYWHSNEVLMKKYNMTNDEIHAIKQSLCEQAGIELLFITEHDWLHCTKKMKHKIADILDEHIKLIHNAK